MKKLNKLFKHCFKVAKKISQQSDLELSKGTMDIPGLDDSQGRAPFADYPVLTSQEQKLRMYFTYEIDRNTFYKTPWLRMVYYIHDIKKENFYRIYKRERSFFNTLMKTFFIRPGKELNSSSSLKDYYYLDCSINKGDIINKIQISDILSKLESFPNLKMIRIDSKGLLVDIKCEEKEHYTEELVLKYIETVNDLMPEFLKI